MRSNVAGLLVLSFGVLGLHTGVSAQVSEKGGCIRLESEDDRVNITLSCEGTNLTIRVSGSGEWTLTGPQGLHKSGVPARSEWGTLRENLSRDSQTVKALRTAASDCVRHRLPVAGRIIAAFLGLLTPEPIDLDRLPKVEPGFGKPPGNAIKCDMCFSELDKFYGDCKRNVLESHGGASYLRRCVEHYADLLQSCLDHCQRITP